MHKGRFVPRVREQVLSEDCRPPYFAPVKIKPYGSLLFDGGIYPLTGADWGEADVDGPHLRITWSGELVVDGRLFAWTNVQSRDGTPTPLRILTVWVADDGSTLKFDFLPTVNQWGWGFGDIFQTGTNVITATGLFEDWSEPGYSMKPYR